MAKLPFGARLCASILKRCGMKTAIGTNNAANREAWLARALGEIPTGSRILDAGAGELAQKRHCSHLDYVAQDFGSYNGSGDGAGLQTGKWDQTHLDIVSDITEIPEPDASFDAIMCIEVFEHLPDPLAALREFTRLLKPSGWLVITAPRSSLTHFAPFHFQSGFNRYFYQHHLPKAGFDIQELSANGNYFGFIAQEVRRTMEGMPSYSDSRPGFWDILGGESLSAHAQQNGTIRKEQP